MEQRSLLASAVGMGVGVGLGLASVRWAKPAQAAEGGSGGAGAAEVEAELRRLLVDGRDSEVTFDEFHHRHCYLRSVAFLAVAGFRPWLMLIWSVGLVLLDLTDGSTLPAAFCH